MTVIDTSVFIEFNSKPASASTGSHPQAAAARGRHIAQGDLSISE
ncbi:MAG TPA: hypothetical protein VLY86_00985 [Methanothrix sp.]|nr:hypothetical protein [Methanothrix sp.]